MVVNSSAEHKISGFMWIPCSIQISLGKSLVTLKPYMMNLFLQTYTNNFLVHFFLLV